jgi:SagB-type dehydrogenase family enzyme
MTQKKIDEQKPGTRSKTKITLSEFYERELRPLADVVTFCNNLQFSLYADTTVVKSPEVVFRGVALSQNRLVSEDYLLNFRRNQADLGVVIGTHNYSLPAAAGAAANRDLEESEDDLLPLPAPKNERAPIGAVIRSRRSIRHYSGKSISLQDLSTLLYHSAGITGRLEAENAPHTAVFGDQPHIDLRAAVSGGGLYPVDLFVVALNVEKLPAGTYQYKPKFHALKPVAGTLPEIARLAQFLEIEAQKAGFLLGYVYNFFENSRKYGEQGLGFAFIEAGAIAAHVHLLSTALGLGSCDVGGFSKRGFERLFHADGVTRHMIHLTVVGKLGEGA